MIMKKILLLIIFTSNSLFAQIEHPVKWSYASKRTGKNEVEIVLKATIENGWHIYSAYQEAGGPVKTSFTFTPGNDYSLIGKVEEPQPVSKFEPVFNVKVKYFENSVTFHQKIRLKSAHPVVKGKLNFMVCNDQKCLPPEDVDFNLPVK